MSWPFFFKDNLIIGNINSNLCICTMWSKKDFFAKNLNKEKYCAIGNLYTSDGISYIIKNILANPVITNLIICGQDLNKSGDVLKNFFENGIDEEGKIIGCDKYVHSNISKTAADIVRKNVKLIDLRGEEGKLHEFVEKVGKEGYHFTAPLFLPDEKSQIEELTSEIIGFRIEGKLHEVWVKVLDIIMKYGEIKQTQHSLRQKEFLDILSVIKDDFSLKPFFGLKQEELEKYFNSFFSDKKGEEVEYSYGERLFRYTFRWVNENFKAEMNFFINQIDNIVEVLKATPFTRRALASLWNPFSDIASESPPCLTQISWCIKNGKLYQTCVFRSHDVFGAYLLNAIALRKLQENVAEKLGIKSGDLIILSHSAHIYENSWKRAEDILNKELRNREMQFEEDKSGYFRIWIDKEKREIVAQHYLADGRKSKFEFRGKVASVLYRFILNENLVSRLDHAAYLGKELGKAEMCLVEEKDYEQDST